MITFIFLGMIVAVIGLTESDTAINSDCLLIFMLCQVVAMVFYGRLKERVKTIENKMKGGDE